jgi:hypothetical protein
LACRAQIGHALLHAVAQIGQGRAGFLRVVARDLAGLLLVEREAQQFLGRAVLVLGRPRVERLLGLGVRRSVHVSGGSGWWRSFRASVGGGSLRWWPRQAAGWPSSFSLVISGGW